MSIPATRSRFGGLDEAQDGRLRNGIPLLKDIPLIGELFKSTEPTPLEKESHDLITPTMLSPRSKVGIAETPQA